MLVTCRVISLHHRARNNAARAIITAPAGKFDAGGDAFDCCV
jgi:hypothetical protein